MVLVFAGESAYIATGAVTLVPLHTSCPDSVSPVRKLKASLPHRTTTTNMASGPPLARSVLRLPTDGATRGHLSHYTRNRRWVFSNYIHRRHCVTNTVSINVTKSISVFSLTLVDTVCLCSWKAPAVFGPSRLFSFFGLLTMKVRLL